MALKSLIQQIANEGRKTEQIYSVVCKVLEVDEKEQTCDCEPLNDDAELFGVRFKANLNNENGLLIVPKVGSNVIVTPINKQTGFVSVVSDIERMEIKLNSITLDIDENEVVFNGGDLDGMVIVGDLVNKLNNLENAFNQLNAEYKSHIHAIVGAIPLLPPTLPTSSPTVSAATPLLTPTIKNEVENKKVKH